MGPFGILYNWFFIIIYGTAYAEANTHPDNDCVDDLGQG